MNVLNMKRGETYKAYNDKNQYVLVTFEGRVNYYKSPLVKIERVGRIGYAERVLMNHNKEYLYVKYFNQFFILKGEPVKKTYDGEIVNIAE